MLKQGEEGDDHLGYSVIDASTQVPTKTQFLVKFFVHACAWSVVSHTAFQIILITRVRILGPEQMKI